MIDFQSARSPSSPEKDVSSSDFSSSSSSSFSPISNTNWMQSLVDTVDQVLRDQDKNTNVITREHVVTVTIENAFQTEAMRICGDVREIHVRWCKTHFVVGPRLVLEHEIHTSQRIRLHDMFVFLLYPSVARDEVESDVMFEMIRKFEREARVFTSSRVR